MKNDMFDFNVLKFYDINTRNGKVVHPLLLGVLLILLLVAVFFMGVWGSLLVVFLLSLIFRLLWLLSFMKLYMSLKKLKILVLLVYDLNVILPWFVLHLLLGLMFLGFFIIGGNTCLDYCGKIRFRISHIFHEGNACADQLANLGFIHRKQFHWYNRLPSSLFLEFSINRYRLSKYRFS